MTEAATLHGELAQAPEGGRAFRFDADGRNLRGAVWPGGGRGTAVIFPGRTEYIEKYGLVIAALVDRGFAVAILDWRGQGLSERPLDDPLKGDVGDFAEYQADVAAFLAHDEVARLPEPLTLFCHSMGGCIGMRALLDERIAPAAAILSAPMFGIHLPLHLRFGARALIRLARRFGFETSFAPAPGGGRPYVLVQPFEGNSLTGDPGAYGRFRRHLEAEPGFGLGAPTLRWMRRSFEEMSALAAAPPADLPTLMFLGDEEDVVAPAAIRAYAAKAPSCRLVEIADARHEVFMETDAILTRVWAEIDGFLDAEGI